MNAFIIKPKKIIPHTKQSSTLLKYNLPKIPFKKNNSRLVLINKNILSKNETFSLNTLSNSNANSNSNSKNTTNTEISITDKSNKSIQNVDFPKISWEDFQAIPNENQWFLSVISWGITYDIKLNKKPFKVEVLPKCYINKLNSWVKYKYDELLKHEQGHFNIGVLCALTFKKKVRRFSFKEENYREDLKIIFNENLREFCLYERKYDKETDHMMNTEMQLKWENEIYMKLQDLKEYM